MPEQNLRPEERAEYELLQHMSVHGHSRFTPQPYFKAMKHLDNLDACRGLLKKREWSGRRGLRCGECGGFKIDGHAPDCAIAAQLAGIGATGAADER